MASTITVSTEQGNSIEARLVVKRNWAGVCYTTDKRVIQAVETRQDGRIAPAQRKEMRRQFDTHGMQAIHGAERRAINSLVNGATANSIWKWYEPEAGRVDGKEAKRELMAKLAETVGY